MQIRILDYEKPARRYPFELKKQIAPFLFGLIFGIAFGVIAMLFVMAAHAEKPDAEKMVILNSNAGNEPEK